MLTNIRQVIIEVIVRFSGHGLSQSEISIITGVSQGAIWKVLCNGRETNSLTQGLRGHWLKTSTSSEDRAFLRFMKGNMFLSASKIRVEWSGELDASPKTFSISWISLKTSRLMPQTDSWLLPPPPHVGTQAPELEPSSLVSSGICFWIQG